MRRAYGLAALAGATGLATLAALWGPVSAGPEKGNLAVAPAPAKDAPQLPISQCVLFSSGVGYFQREAEIEGNTRVDLTFPASDINDLLKSMVLQDMGGGHVAAVSYESHDPIDKTLRSFSVNLTQNPTFGQILNQARGEKVEVTQQQVANQPGTLTGTIIGVEKQKQPAGKDGTVDVECLNLWCAEGMRSVKLSDLQRVRFLNPVMESEFRRALEVLALSHDTQKKAVTLTFEGQGRRPVRVGYVIENPIWKTSYRLMLNKEGKPYLQGWAVVENPTDEDWKDVRMALVSGRPISFQMDLYQPLYVPRPTVVPELFASLMPKTYEGGMERDNKGIANERAPKDWGMAPPADEKKNEQLDRLGAMRAGAGGGKRGLATHFDDGKSELALRLDQGMASSANAAQLGDFFQYSIDHPVNLARQKSAMLPIVTKEVEGTKVSIYNQGTHAKFPLHGLKFKNTSGLHLMQGPLTVFDGNSYAGDARILDLQPGEERLLSYAVDLGTEVEAVNPTSNGTLTKVKLYKGLLYSTTRVQEGKVFHAKNRTEQDRLLIIEHPYRQEFNLVKATYEDAAKKKKEIKPSERARDVYRFEVSAPAGKTITTEVLEECDVVTTVQLNNTNDDTIRYFVSQSVSSAKVKEALQKAVELKNKHVSTQQELAQVEKQLKVVTDDQARLRANLKETPATAPVYKRYLEKLEKQESEIEKMQASQKKLQDAELVERQAFDSYLATLDVE
ncbi:MAG TPA: DUF4139 domain-containing protein [Gemmataceae bacterium]|nr:DUF4139 domain-containing protein [Gemmataceae bacterium]